MRPCAAGLRWRNLPVDSGLRRTTISGHGMSTTPRRRPMKYLCLVYHEEATIDALPEGEYNALVGEFLDFREELRRSDHYGGSSPLQPVHTATTIRVRSGKLSIADGPFAETREQLGGFYL